MKFLSYIFFRLLVTLFSILPFRLVYFFSDVLRFLFKHVLKYRVSVVDKNLEYCFPTLSSSKRLDIRNKFYKNFIDIILESIKGLATDPNRLMPRYTFRNPELLDSYFEKDQHLIFYSQHFNNWEWAPICLGLQMQHHLLGVVKMISNKYINNYFIDGRSGNNVSVIPTFHTARYFSELDKVESPVGIVFIADQKPSGKERSIELPFLGAKASFHAGAGKYAFKSGLPVFSLDVLRVGRGHYEIVTKEIAGAGECTSGDELTIRFKEHLEKLIKDSPESWLWSHKRFKDFISY